MSSMEEYNKIVCFIVLCEGTRSFMSDKISRTSKVTLRIDEINLRSPSERRVDSEGMLKFECINKC